MNSRVKIIIAIGAIAGLLAASLSVAAQNNDNGDEREFFPFATDEFFDVWERTDYPVEQQEVDRTWIWGPGPITPGMQEEYEEADDDERLVQYFDKSRMEWPWAPEADPESEWFITQGLLATELMTGNLQLGDEEFEQHPPAEIPVAGDWEDQTGPTYAAMGEYIDWDPRETGSTITQIMDRDGDITDDPELAEFGVTDAHYIEQTDHNIASVFWDFMQSEGLIFVDDDYDTGPIFLNEFYAIGFPKTEAYWGWVQVAGVDQNVLIQCFERRCLTYAPGNPDGWQVESGNVGLHYYEWRYNIIDREDPIVDLDLHLSPDGVTNDINTEFTLTATVMENGAAVAIDQETDVSIEVVRAFDDNGAGNGVVDVNETIALDTAGAATITYMGPGEPAVDTITVNVDYNDEELSATTTKTWALPDPDPELALELAQDEPENVVGSTHQFTATLTENGDPVNIDEDDDEIAVAIERDGAALDPIDGLTVVVASNVATISYTGPDEPAVDTIDVTITVDDDVVVGDPTLTKTWVADEPDVIVLSHTGDDFDNPELAATNTLGVDDDHTVYAEVRDEHGNLVSDGVEIVFEVRDPGDSTVIFETSVDATTEDGVASFIYDAPDNPRNDEIVASWDAGAVTEEDALTKSWEAAVVVTSVTIEASPNPVQGWPTQNTSFSIEAEGTDLEGEEIEVCRDPANAPGTFTIAGTGSGTQADSCYTVTLDSAGEMVEDLGYDTVFAAGPNSATIEFTATHEASGEDDSVVVEFVGTGFQI